MTRQQALQQQQRWVCKALKEASALEWKSSDRQTDRPELAGCPLLLSLYSITDQCIVYSLVYFELRFGAFYTIYWNSFPLQRSAAWTAFFGQQPQTRVVCHQDRDLGCRCVLWRSQELISLLLSMGYNYLPIHYIIVIIPINQYSVFSFTAIMLCTDSFWSGLSRKPKGGDFNNISLSIDVCFSLFYWLTGTKKAVNLVSSRLLKSELLVFKCSLKPH